jgi:hypothetical protein
LWQGSAAKGAADDIAKVSEASAAVARRGCAGNSSGYYARAENLQAEPQLISQQISPDPLIRLKTLSGKIASGKSGVDGNGLPRQREIPEGIRADDALAQHVAGDTGMFCDEDSLEPIPGRLCRAVQAGQPSTHNHGVTLSYQLGRGIHRLIC